MWIESRTRMVAIVTLLSERGRGERLCLAFPSQASFFFERDLAGPSGGQIASLELLDCVESLVPAVCSAKDRDQKECGFDVGWLLRQIFQKIFFCFEVRRLQVGRLGKHQVAVSEFARVLFWNFTEPEVFGSRAK